MDVPGLEERGRQTGASSRRWPEAMRTHRAAAACGGLNQSILRAFHALNEGPLGFCVMTEASGKRRLEASDELCINPANGLDRASDALLYALPQEGHCQSAA